MSYHEESKLRATSGLAYLLWNIADVFSLFFMYPSLKNEMCFVHPVHAHHKCRAPTVGHESSRVRILYFSPLGEILLQLPYRNTIKPQEQQIQ